MFLSFKEILIINDIVNNIADVVGLVGRLGNDRIQLFFRTVARVGRRDERWVVHVVGRDERQEFAGDTQCVFVGISREVSDTRLCVVRHRTAEFVFGHLFVRHRLDDVGPGDEHVGRVLHHHVKVGDCR